jgi:hypothetical protein
MKKLIYLLSLIFVLTGSVLAQTSDPVISYSGVQTTEGVLDKSNDKRWGNTFVVFATDEDRKLSSRQLTISLDYVGGDPNFESGNDVVSGTWSLNIYIHGQHVGTIFGEVLGGKILWNVGGGIMQPDKISSQQAIVELRVTGGLGKYDHLGTGEPIYGSFNSFTKMTSPFPQTSATLMLDF